MSDEIETFVIINFIGFTCIFTLRVVFSYAEWESFFVLHTKKRKQKRGALLDSGNNINVIDEFLCLSVSTQCAVSPLSIFKLVSKCLRTRLKRISDFQAITSY